VIGPSAGFLVVLAVRLLIGGRPLALEVIVARLGSQRGLGYIFGYIRPSASADAAAL
jgi:hypothetical protein